MFLVRAHGEVDYLVALDAIPNAVIEGCRGQGIVADEAWLWPRAQLLSQFRFAKKRGTYLGTFVRNERRLRNGHGYPIPYQCLATFGLVPAWFERAFCSLTAFGRE